jgi:steroid delta-isomerase-like uncharacterized protein
MATDRTTRNKQLVDDFIQELFTKGDLDAVDRYLHPEFVNHDPDFPGAPEGPEALRQAAAMMREALPDWHSDVHQLVAEGDLVVERFTASGTHRGELMGAPPTGETVVLRGINIFRVDGDRIVERWAGSTTSGCCAGSGWSPADPTAELPDARRSPGRATRARGSTFRCPRCPAPR